MLAEAKVLKMVADAEAAEDKALTDKLRLKLDDMISRRQALTAVAVAEIGAKKVEKGTSG
jgi:hypothetical protein